MPRCVGEAKADHEGSQLSALSVHHDHDHSHDDHDHSENDHDDHVENQDEIQDYEFL